MFRTDSLPMRWHCLQHVPFEGPASLETWVYERGHIFTTTKLWETTAFPNQYDYDGLFVLGGPMNVYEVEKYPWLAAEQHFIARAISKRKPILGVCLGAQLLAAVLGGTVVEMLDKEIGWFPVDLTPAGRESLLFYDFPDRFTAFHWHGDRFSIPPGAIHIARSEACEEQAFVYMNHVVGLQFHLESQQPRISAMIKHSGADFSCGQYIQDPGAMEYDSNALPVAHRLLFSLLDRLSLGAELQLSPGAHSLNAGNTYVDSAKEGRQNNSAGDNFYSPI